MSKPRRERRSVTAVEAVEYGLIDEVVSTRKTATLSSS